MEIFKGRKTTFSVPVTQGGVPLSLEGYTAELVLALNPGDTPALIKTVIISTVITSIPFIILPADTTSLSATDYKAEVNIFRTADHTAAYTVLSFVAEVKAPLDLDPTD
jgi:hypothetical protein